MTSLETASDSLRRQAGERDEAEAAGQVRLATCGAVGENTQAGRGSTACPCKLLLLTVPMPAHRPTGSSLTLPPLFLPLAAQEANDAVFELNERVAGQEAELAAAREALAAHQQRAAELEVGGWVMLRHKDWTGWLWRHVGG